MTPGRQASARAFVEGAALIDLEGSIGALFVTGKDARDFLQRMISCDLSRIGPDRGASSVLMTHKGRMLAAFEIYPRDDGFLLLVEPVALERLAESLEKFIILETVEVTRPDTRLRSLQGPRATDLLRSIFSDRTLAEEEHALVAATFDAEPVLLMRRRRCASGGWDLETRDGGEGLTARLIAAGAVPTTVEAAEPHRIDAGIPRYGIDATDAHLPLEAGYDASLSYDKGCYAGQEVVARIRTYGHVNRLLRRIRLRTAEVPCPGDAVRFEGKDVGEVTSACLSPSTGHGVALAYVRREAAATGGRVTVVAAGTPHEAQVEPLGVPGTPESRE